MTRLSGGHRALQVTVCCVALLLASPAAAQQKSLYERLGGYDAIAAVVDDFTAKLFADPVLGKRFFGMGDDSRRSFRQNNKTFFCMVTGGPCAYLGRRMTTSHRGLGITTAEYALAVDHIAATLRAFAVPAREHDEVIALIESLAPSIVEDENG